MPRCKFCNTPTVTWRLIGGRWILYNNDGTRHLCVTQKPNQGKQQGDGEPSEQKDNLPEAEMNPETGEPVEKSIIEQMEAEMESDNSQDGDSQNGESGEEESKDSEDGESKGDSDKESKDSKDAKDSKDSKETPNQKASITDIPVTLKKSMKQGHKQTYELYALLASGMKVFVSGPAGSGKTTAFKLVTPALGHYFQRDDYDFYFKSVCDLTGKHEFEGFINAAGQIVDTDFRKAYTEGHLFLIDEIDAANANVLTVLNATIENGWASFPDGKHPQHPHFRIGVAANTVGLGGDGIYIGRNQLDGAFRNRFYFLVWDYDERLELRLSGYPSMPAGPAKDSIKAWVDRVQAIRAAHNSLGKLAPRVVISPRATINGATLIRNGIVTKFNALEDALIWQGCSDDDKTRVLKAVKQKAS